MRKLLAWLGAHPLRIVFAMCAFFVVLGVAAHFLVNWLAEERWQDYCKTARARGVKISLAELAPTEIPDSENFAALPMFRAIFATGAKSPMSLRLPGEKPTEFGQPLKGQRLDWKVWQAVFQKAGFITALSESPPRDVLRGLEHYAPQIAEWSQWRVRPRCRFPLDYKAGKAMDMPHESLLRDGAELFSLRMRAHLALGDSEAAYADFQEGLQAYRALETEPILLSALVQIASVSLVISSIGDGLSDHRWSDSELTKIEGDLAQIRMGMDYRRALSGGRGFQNAMYDQIVDGSLEEGAKMVTTIPISSTMSLPFALIPRHLCRDNQFRSNQYIDELLKEVSRDGSEFLLDTPKSFDPENLTNDFERFYFVLHRLTAPYREDVTRRFILCETRIRQARLACALERFHIAKGVFPETLEKLVPDFIRAVPLDTYSGKPMIYRQKDPGSFVLYSVGSNRLDDGGVIDPDKTEKRQLDDVWLYAPASAP